MSASVFSKRSLAASWEHIHYLRCDKDICELFPLYFHQVSWRSSVSIPPCWKYPVVHVLSLWSGWPITFIRHSPSSIMRNWLNGCVPQQAVVLFLLPCLRILTARVFTYQKVMWSCRDGFLNYYNFPTFLTWYWFVFVWWRNCPVLKVLNFKISMKNLFNREYI